MNNKFNQKGFGTFKLLMIVAIAIILIFVLIVIFGPKQQVENIGGEKKDTEGVDDAQLANPASTYCFELGGIAEIRSLADGSQKGFCLFDDGSECEEWDFFYGYCEMGESFCQDLCGDGICQEVVCLAVGCPCPETLESCPEDCQ